MLSAKNNQTKIEPATKDRITDILFLNSFVQEMHREHHPEHFKSSKLVSLEAISFLERIIKTENNYIFIAYYENNPVGYIWFTIDNIPENPFKMARRQIHIHQIAVHRQYRKHSIGRALFNKAEAIARQNNIAHYELDTWAFNASARAFFEKLGFETFKIQMWKTSQ